VTTNTPSTDLSDPESLRDDDTVDVHDETHDVDGDDLASARALDSHVVVGVVADRGVLLQNDGHHGWTLPAFPVAEGEDWYAVASREFAALTGTAVSVEAPERLRNREYRLSHGDENTVVRDLVVRASPNEPLHEEAQSRADGTEIEWTDGVPADVPGPVADDISLFVD
jgi:predicted NUDIX family NTP pyrophosphohydrolase